MSNIPCILDCHYQANGICNLDCAAKVTCTNGPCPHYINKEQANNSPAPFKYSYLNDNPKNDYSSN